MSKQKGGAYARRKRLFNQWKSAILILNEKIKRVYCLLQLDTRSWYFLLVHMKTFCRSLSRALSEIFISFMSVMGVWNENKVARTDIDWNISCISEELLNYTSPCIIPHLRRSSKLIVLLYVRFDLVRRPRKIWIKRNGIRETNVR